MQDSYRANFREDLTKPAAWCHLTMKLEIAEGLKQAQKENVRLPPFETFLRAKLSCILCAQD